MEVLTEILRDTKKVDVKMWAIAEVAVLAGPAIGSGRWHPELATAFQHVVHNFELAILF